MIHNSIQYIYIYIYIYMYIHFIFQVPFPAPGADGHGLLQGRLPPLEVLAGREHPHDADASRLDLVRALGLSVEG